MKNHYLDQRIRIKKPNLSLTEKKISDYFVHSESLLTQMTLEKVWPTKLASPNLPCINL